MGINKCIADFVNRNIDYGTSWAFHDRKINSSVKRYESALGRQLNFFHQKDLEEDSVHNSYVKAFYLHHLLDYFKETRINIYEINAVFDQFLNEKIETEFINNEGKKVNFQEVIDDIFNVLKDNKKELYEDLKGGYLIDL